MARVMKNLPLRGNNALKVTAPSFVQLNLKSQIIDETAHSKSDLYQQQRFTHHGLTSYIGAESWPDENPARAAMALLRSWVTQHSSGQTTKLFVLLGQERSAIIKEIDFDYQQAPLPAMRAAQRLAVRAAIQGSENEEGPLVFLRLVFSRLLFSLAHKKSAA